jgi:hypothetical protein
MPLLRAKIAGNSQAAISLKRTSHIRKADLLRGRKRGNPALRVNPCSRDLYAGGLSG